MAGFLYKLAGFDARTRAAGRAMLKAMDKIQVDRLRRAIHRSYGSSPHKKKYWLALLEMYVAADKVRQSGLQKPEQPRGG
jgi:hypothetical protein